MKKTILATAVLAASVSAVSAGSYNCEFFIPMSLSRFEIEVAPDQKPAGSDRLEVSMTSIKEGVFSGQLEMKVSLPGTDGVSTTVHPAQKAFRFRAQMGEDLISAVCVKK